MHQVIQTMNTKYKQSSNQAKAKLTHSLKSGSIFRYSSITLTIQPHLGKSYLELRGVYRKGISVRKVNVFPVQKESSLENKIEHQLLEDLYQIIETSLAE